MNRFVSLLVVILFPFSLMAAGLTTSSLNGVSTNIVVYGGSLNPGGGQSLGISNLIGSASSSSAVVLSVGVFDGGSNDIHFPVGLEVIGISPEKTEISFYNNSLDTLTNGTAFSISDNCTLANLFINQTQSEQFPLQTLGSQRKNQTIPTKSASDLASTSTNVIIRNVKVFGKKLQAVVLDCTNTFSWKFFDSSIIVSATAALTIGNTISSAGEISSPNSVSNSSDYVELNNTDLWVTNGNGTVAVGAYFTSGGTFKMFGGHIVLNRNNAAGSAYGIIVGGNNSVADLGPSDITFTGPFAASNCWGVEAIGTNCTIIIRGSGITNYIDNGVSNTWIFVSYPTTAAVPTLTVSNAISSTLSLTLDTGANATAYTVTSSNSVTVTSQVLWTNTFPFAYPKPPHIIGPTLVGGPLVGTAARPYVASVTTTNFQVMATTTAFPATTNSWSFLVLP